MKKLIRLSLFAVVSSILILSMTNSVTAQDEHEGHENVENTCDEHDQMVAISTDPTQLAFNDTEINVDKGSCVMFMFMNMQDSEHDFVLHDADGDELFGLHIMNSTSGMKSVMWQMPNEDTELEFWCTVTGHKDAGMQGVVIVGEGNSSSLPGYGFVTAFVALAVAIPLLRRRNR